MSNWQYKRFHMGVLGLPSSDVFGIKNKSVFPTIPKRFYSWTCTSQASFTLAVVRSPHRRRAGFEHEGTALFCKAPEGVQITGSVVIIKKTNSVSAEM